MSNFNNSVCHIYQRHLHIYMEDIVLKHPKNHLANQELMYWQWNLF